CNIVALRTYAEQFIPSPSLKSNPHPTRRKYSKLKQIELPPRGLETLFGVHDQNIKYLESLLDVQINGRGHSLAVDGDPKDVETVERILEDFSELFAEGRQFTDKELREAFGQIAEDRAYSLRDDFTRS